MKTLRRSARWLRFRALGGALILGYHRVSDDSFDPYSISVTPKRFAEHMEALRRDAHPLSLREIVRGLQNGKLPPRAVAVTLDDGYADNLYNAKPLLERYGVPATVFVTTGYPGQEFWWDELARIILASSGPRQPLPPDLGLEHTGANVHAKGAIADRDPNPSQRETVLKSYSALLPLPPTQLQRAMLSLREWSPDNHGKKYDHRSLSPEEVLQLAEGGLVEIGAHSLTHPVLANLTPGEQRAEVVQSRRYLQQLLGREVDGFSYPNSSFTRDTQAILRDAGFTYACTGGEGAACRGSDHFRLTRSWAPNSDGASFSRWLRRWL